jgi:uncharacterized phage infection (PIP) family protein YhgE
VVASVFITLYDPRATRVPLINLPAKIRFDIKSNGSYKMPEDLVSLMKTADVTNITERIKTLSSKMFEEMTPKLISDIQAGVQKGIDGMKSGLPEMEKNVMDIQKGYDGLTDALKGMDDGVVGLEKAIGRVKAAISRQKAALGQINKQREALLVKIDDTKAKQRQMLQTIAAIEAAEADIGDTVNKMIALKEAVPAAFAESEKSYLTEIDRLSPEIEGVFQKTLNGGFKQVYLTSAVASAIALLALMLYGRKKVKKLLG